MIQKIICFVSAAFLLSACSTRKNSFFNRQYHRITSQYNVLFNGEQAYEEGLTSLKNNYKDDYAEILSLTGLPEIKQDSMELVIPELSKISFDQNEKRSKVKRSLDLPVEEINPFETSRSSSSGSSGGGFKKAEIKALKTIENHSMIIKGIERNEKIPEAFLLLGKARYFQGKSFAALEALNQITQRSKNNDLIDEAHLWTAKVEMQTENYYSGLKTLEKLSKKKTLKRDLRETIATTQAEIFIKQKKYERAIKSLDKAFSLSRNTKTQMRYSYIQGQLYFLLNNTGTALKKFQYIAEKSPDFELGFRAKMALAHNFDPKTQDYNSLSDYLKELLKDDKYYDLQDHVYYALGKVAERSGKKDEAQAHYQKALEQKTNSASDAKGNIYKSMGDVFFKNAKYVEAAAYYDSALAVLPQNQTKTLLTQKRENMKAVIDNHAIVQKNDSILLLVHMSPEERKSFFQKHIDRLKKEDEEKQLREEERRYVSGGFSKASGFSSTFEDVEKTAFYFYNATARETGINEFISLWGNRSLGDNWRISARTTPSIESENALAGQTQKETKNPRRYDVSYYLEKIPQDSAVIDSLRRDRDQAELKLGIAYLEKLQDEKAAIGSLENLLTKNPTDSLKLKAYYNLYKAYKKAQRDQAETYKNKVIEKFPSSLYAKYLLNPQPEYFARESAPASVTMYAQAYEAFKSEDLPTFERLYKEMIEKFPKDKIIIKLSLLKAIVEGKTKGKAAFIAALNPIIVQYPESDEAKKAQEILTTLQLRSPADRKSPRRHQENPTPRPTEKRSDEKIKQMRKKNSTIQNAR